MPFYAVKKVGQNSAIYTTHKAMKFHAAGITGSKFQTLEEAVFCVFDISGDVDLTFQPEKNRYVLANNDKNLKVQQGMRLERALNERNVYMHEMVRLQNQVKFVLLKILTIFNYLLIGKDCF